MDLKVKANPRGLIPLKIVRAFAPYNKGTIAGFSPAMAQVLIDRGDAVMADQPMPKSAAQRPGPAARVIEPTTTVDGVIEIPVDILSRHHLQRIKLAKDLLGDKYDINTGGMTPTEYATKVIRDEMDRRAKVVADLK